MPVVIQQESRLMVRDEGELQRPQKVPMKQRLLEALKSLVSDVGIISVLSAFRDACVVIELG